MIIIIRESYAQVAKRTSEMYGLYTFFNSYRPVSEVIG